MTIVSKIRFGVYNNSAAFRKKPERCVIFQRCRAPLLPPRLAFLAAMYASPASLAMRAACAVCSSVSGVG